MKFSFLNVLRFSAFVVQLSKRNWSEFIKLDNPVAAALLCKTGFGPEERMQVRLEFLRMVTRLQMDPARMRLIGGFFDTYLQLTEREEEQVKQTLQERYPEEGAKVMEIMTHLEEVALQRGLEQGIEQGRTEAMVTLAKEMLRDGILSIEQVAKYTGLDKVELDRMKNSDQ